MVAAVISVALLLAFANGANDNFKGVATLLGSRTGGYRKVLLWATVTTFLGSLFAIVLAGELLARFQGKGLVSPEVAGDPGFATAVALGAALTVLLATRLGDLDCLGTIDEERGYDDLLLQTEEMSLSSGRTIRVLSLPALIDAKERSGRPKDLAALPVLRATLDERTKN